MLWNHLGNEDVWRGTLLLTHEWALALHAAPRCKDPTSCEVTSCHTVGTGCGCWVLLPPPHLPSWYPHWTLLPHLLSDFHFLTPVDYVWRFQSEHRVGNTSEYWYLGDDNKIRLTVALKYLSSSVCPWKCRIYYSVVVILFLIRML